MRQIDREGVGKDIELLDGVLEHLHEGNLVVAISSESLVKQRIIRNLLQYQIATDQISIPSPRLLERGKARDLRDPLSTRNAEPGRVQKMLRIMDLPFAHMCR